MSNIGELQKTVDRSFWEKPEGKTGILFAALAVGAGSYGLYRILPFIISLLENTVHATLLAGVLVVLTSPIWNSKVRLLTSYFFRSAMRAITGFFVEIDPIGILKNYIEDLKKNQLNMERQIANLKGSITRVQSLIEKNQADASHALRIAQAAKQEQNKAALVLNSRKAGRLDKSNFTLQAMLNKMHSLYKMLNKMKEVSDIMVQDMESEVTIKEQERAALLASYGAFTSAMKILKGDPDSKALYDQAMEHLADDYARKVGEIENFMEVSEGFIASVDLDNLVFEQEALEKLEQLERRSDQLLLGSDLVPSQVDSVHAVFANR